MSICVFQLCYHCSLALAPGELLGTPRFDTPESWLGMCRLLALRLDRTNIIAGRFARIIYPRFRSDN